MKPLTWKAEGSKGTLYTVTLSTEGMVCTCPARVEECRHVRAVRMLQRLALLDKEAVNALAQMALAVEKCQEEDDPFARTGYQPEPAPKPMSAKEKLDDFFGDDEVGVTHEY